MPDLGNTSVFSQTDANNNTGTMPSWSGSASPNTIDDAGRGLQGAVFREWNWRNFTLTAGGTADAKTLTYGTAPAAYYNGQRFAFIANTVNTGSATLNVNSVGAKTIKSMLTGTLANLAAGDMVAGTYVEVAYNTANDCFVWVNQKATVELPQALDTSDSPQFAGVNVGHASDTTVTRASAGILAVEGNHVPSPGSAVQGDVLYHNGTTWARLGAGTSGQYLKTNGAAANPEWASSSGGAVILGNISTASGTSASLGSLVLTDYKIVELWFRDFSITATSQNILLGTSTSDDVAIFTTGAAAATMSGIVKIDLADGIAHGILSTGADAAGVSGDTVIGTGSTTISIATAAGDFDSGTIRVVGYK